MRCPSCQSGDVAKAKANGFTVCYNCGCQELTANFLEVGDKIKRDDIGIYPCDDKELTYEETQAVSIPDKSSAINNGGKTDYYDLKPEWEDGQDIIEDREMNYAQGNMFKVALTFNVGRHSGTDYERDLNKIMYFAQRELDRIQNES